MFAIRDHLPRPGGAGEPDDVATDTAGVPDSEPDSPQRRYLTESTRFGRRFSQPSPLREAFRLVEAGQYDSAEVALSEIVKENPPGIGRGGHWRSCVRGGVGDHGRGAG